MLPSLLEMLLVALRVLGLVRAAKAVFSIFFKPKTLADQQLKEVLDANKANNKISEMPDSTLGTLIGGAVVRDDPEGPDGKAGK